MTALTTTPHQTALALQRLTEALADVSLAVSSATTTEELFHLWSQFAPLMEAGHGLQDRLGSAVDALLAKKDRT